MVLAANVCLLVGAVCVAVLAITDLRKLILPDLWVGILAAAGLLFHVTTGWAVLSPLDALFGAVVGSSLLLLLRAIFFRTHHVEAIGLGDVKLMLAAGLWVGMWHLPLLLLGAALLSLAGVGVIAWRAGRTVSVRGIRFPFGFSVCLALTALVAVQSLWHGTAYAQFGIR